MNNNLKEYDDSDDELDFISHKKSYPALMIRVPENPTNGDIIKALYPDVIIHEYSIEIVVLLRNDDHYQKLKFDPSWWNKPYKKGE